MLSLVADYDTTSSSNSENDDTTDNDAEEKPAKTCSSSSTITKSSLVLLPSPNFILSGGSSKPTGDVFSNPFLEAEKSEIEKLEKHVKMVESENHLQQKNGRKICWNNRKGRCRFGNKCKYAHDSDLVKGNDIKDVDKINLDKVNKIPAATIQSASSEANIPNIDVPSDSNKKNKSLKRPGLGDSIVPGKRVMKIYHNTSKSSL